MLQMLVIVIIDSGENEVNLKLASTLDLVPPPLINDQVTLRDIRERGSITHLSGTSRMNFGLGQSRYGCKSGMTEGQKSGTCASHWGIQLELY